ncbi:MAG: 50S ribosomal protein L30 [Spirochaetales bacterium]|nr:50S ribosomal protein L30 [Spirochaetales bacterium]
MRKIEEQISLIKDLEAAAADTKKIRVTLVRSTIGRKVNQIKTVKALGLRKINSVVEKDVNPVILGMVKTVSHLVEVEEIS